MTRRFARLVVRSAAVALAIALIPAIAGAQQFTGRVDVVVEDSTGGRLPGAQVDLVGPVSQSQTTDGQGEAHFLNLPVGIYTLRTTLSGFNTFVNNTVQ